MAHTALQNTNAELVQLTSALQAANRELETFSYSVSHDLRAPLRSINGFSQVLLEDAGTRLDAQDKESLLRICGAAQRMGQLLMPCWPSPTSRGRTSNERTSISVPWPRQLRLTCSTRSRRGGLHASLLRASMPPEIRGCCR